MQNLTNSVTPLVVRYNIESPCIKMCRLLNEVCTGCYRTINEIRYWSITNDIDKLKILNNCKKRKNMKVTFTKKHELAKLPSYESAGAAGADVYSVDTITIPSGGSALVSTGLGCNVPDGYEIQVRPRSGLALKKQITVLNSPGTVDSDYRGILGVIIINHSNNSFTISEGDRIAQIVVSPVVRAKFDFVEIVDSTARGEQGYGSTG